MRGRVVCSKAGRDKGKFMVLVGSSDSHFYLCDGKERPLERPKSKIGKHIQFTNCVFEEKQFLTNKSLRRALAEYRSKDGQMQVED